MKAHTSFTGGPAPWIAHTYRLSQYCRVIQVPASPTALLHNTLTGAKVIVPGELAADLQKGSLTALPQGDHDRLVQLGFLVPRDHDDFGAFCTRLDEMMEHHRTFSFTLATTMACNLACHYCFQHDLRSSHSLSDSVARTIAGQIATFCRRQDIVGVRGVIFGGEPLLCQRPLDVFLEELRALLGSDTPFDFLLVTNGTLLTAPALDRLMTLGLSSVQISLDGPPDVHDRRRPSRKDGVSFHAAFDAVRLAATRVQTVVNTVVDPTNGPFLIDLLIRIANTIGNRQRLSIHYTKAMVRHTLTIKGAPADSCGSTKTDRFIADAMIAGARMGLRVLGPGSRIPCTQYKNNSVAFGPDGTVYKCVDVIDDSRFAVGADLKDTTAAAIEREWMSQCRTCSVAPLCLGGCGYKGLAHGRAMTDLYCERDYLETASDAHALAGFLSQ